MQCMVPSKAITVHQSASAWYQVFAVARREQCLLGVATLLGSALAAVRLGFRWISDRYQESLGMMIPAKLLAMMR